MTIDAYISASRRCKKPGDLLGSLYTHDYGLLCLQLPFGAQPPHLRITYSTSRQCECVLIGEEKYLVFDQYLGQGFARLNRVLFAKHSWPQLTFSFACKYVAEQLVNLGNPRAAMALACCSRNFAVASKEKGDPFIFDAATEFRRHTFTRVQEMFVLAHELAHYVFLHHKPADFAKVAESLEQRFADLLRDEENDPLNRDDIVARYGEKLANDLIEQWNHGEDRKRRGKLFEEHKAELIPELASDDLGATLAFRAAVQHYEIPASDVSQAIMLAFKYSRLFHHLDMLANTVNQLWGSTSLPDRQELHQDLKHVALGSGVDKRVQRAQLREMLLRYELLLISAIYKAEPLPIHREIANTNDMYDARIESVVLTGFLDFLCDVLRDQPPVLTDAPSSDEDCIVGVDKILGWGAMSEDEIVAQVRKRLSGHTRRSNAKMSRERKRKRKKR